MGIGEEVARLRTRKGWSREELASLVPMSVAGLTDIENGVTERPQRRTVAGLARALDVPEEVLTGETPLPSPRPASQEEVEILENYRQLNLEYRQSARAVLAGLLREQRAKQSGQG